MERGTWWAAVHGVAKSRHDWVTDTFTFSLPPPFANVVFKTRRGDCIFSNAQISAKHNKVHKETGKHSPKKETE